MLHHNRYLIERLAEQHREQLLAEADQERLLRLLQHESQRESLRARLARLLAGRLERAAASRAQ